MKEVMTRISNRKYNKSFSFSGLYVLYSSRSKLRPLKRKDSALVLNVDENPTILDHFNRDFFPSIFITFSPTSVLLYT